MEPGAHFSAIVTTACISSAIVLAVSAWFRNKSPVISKPKKWVKVGRVKKLVIYPIKSCQGVETSHGVMTSLGLKFPDANIRDRDFLVVDDNGNRLTMVNLPRLALVKIDIKGQNSITLDAPEKTTLTITCPSPNGSNQRLCKIKHDHHIKALDCGEEAAKWFESFLDKKQVRLVYYYLNKTQRTLDPLYQTQCPAFNISDLGSFQNATSYHLVAEESIEELNNHLERKMTWKNFRPTILIDSVAEPFAEHNWSFVKIGQDDNTILNVAAPCHRCPIPTVDQEVGVMSKDGEPLKTLRRMKLNDQLVDDQLKNVMQNKGLLGLRVGLHPKAEEGAIIREGDPVYAALL